MRLQPAVESAYGSGIRCNPQGVEPDAAGLSCGCNHDLDSKRNGEAIMQIFVDADALMRDFRNYGSRKKATIEDILRSDYGRDSKLPGKAVLEKAVRLIDDTCNISDPMTFYRRVDELFDILMKHQLNLAI